jgi:aspartyl protease family protein
MRRSGVLPSFGLAFLFTVGAGLPGLSPMVAQSSSGINLFAMTTLDAEGSGHFITTASINNRSIEVLIDTGATAVAMSFEDAERAGLRPNTLKYDVPVNTANGVGKAARVTLREVEIGSVRVSDVEGLVLQRGALRGTLLGMSFLSRLRSFSVENGKFVLKN